jgi:GPH family glycoside/pentoside/hexuronide:cation symporter
VITAAASALADDARRTLLRYSMFGAALAFAGPPIYIHTPRLYADQHGLGLATVGAILLCLRILDFGQDPILGWWISRTKMAWRTIAAIFAATLGVGALALFAPAPMLDGRIWLGVSLAIVFTGFSGLQILFYSTGVSLAEQSNNTVRHDRIAGWREAGVLVGICAACVAPIALGAVLGEVIGFTAFAVVFCLFLAYGVYRMRGVWPASGTVSHKSSQASGLRCLFRDRNIRRLLLIGLLNALPGGLTATLFLFFVEDRLQAGGHAGPMLLLFFASAGLAAPLWSKAAARFGPKAAMLCGMLAAISAFLWALTLGAGDWMAFYVISSASGAALGADMTLLPAMLSRRLAVTGLDSAQACGVWGFRHKASLAVAAGVALPLISYAGFAPGPGNSEAALSMLAIAYAGAPCALKAIAAALLFMTPISKEA